MKNINDYKGTKTAIHCKTQDEWDKITELLGYTFRNGTWSNYESESCIKCDANGYCDLDYYTSHNYTILPASDFMPTPRTIEQIDAELEVLRNELKLLKAEAQTPEKKPIEFVKYLSVTDMGLNKTCSNPSDFENLELLHINGHYDIIKAWDNVSDVFIFLGHWNDGIK